MQLHSAIQIARKSSKYLMLRVPIDAVDRHETNWCSAVEVTHL